VQGIKLGKHHVVLAGGTKNMFTAWLIMDGTTNTFDKALHGLQLMDCGMA